MRIFALVLGLAGALFVTTFSGCGGGAEVVEPDRDNVKLDAVAPASGGGGASMTAEPLEE